MADTIIDQVSSVRGDPGPRFTLRHGDLDFGHQLGDLAPQRNGVGAAFQGCKVEPFMRGDEIDDAGTPARPVKTAFEQHVGDRACFHWRCRIQIDVPLKHLSSPFLFFAASAERGSCPIERTPRYFPTPFAGLLG